MESGKFTILPNLVGTELSMCSMYAQTLSIFVLIFGGGRGGEGEEGGEGRRERGRGGFLPI